MRNWVMRNRVKLAIAVPLALVVLATVGSWTYLNVIKDDAPDRLTLGGGGTTPAQSSATTAATGGTTDSSPLAPGPTSGIDGTWKVIEGSQAGYRVKEILFGQSAVAVGRTDDVTGQISIAGATVTSGSFTVDMTSVASDESRRDNQFRSRIMNVSTYPTSTFEVTKPIALSSVPPDGTTVDVKATGELTLRGTTKEVTVGLEAQRSGSTIKVAGSVPIVFEDWGIPNPSFGPADTEDSGDLEFLLVFGR